MGSFKPYFYSFGITKKADIIAESFLKWGDKTEKSFEKSNKSIFTAACRASGGLVSLV